MFLGILLKVGGWSSRFGWKAAHTPGLTSKAGVGRDRPPPAFTEDLGDGGRGDESAFNKGAELSLNRQMFIPALTNLYNREQILSFNVPNILKITWMVLNRKKCALKIVET